MSVGTSIVCVKPECDDTKDQSETGEPDTGRGNKILFGYAAAPSCVVINPIQWVTAENINKNQKAILQGWAQYGPHAKSGPLNPFVRPEE